MGNYLSCHTPENVPNSRYREDDSGDKEPKGESSPEADKKQINDASIDPKDSSPQKFRLQRKKAPSESTVNDNQSSTISRASWDSKGSSSVMHKMKKSQRKNPPTLDMNLGKLEQPIVGCPMSPQLTYIDPARKPPEIKWLKKRPGKHVREWKNLCSGDTYTPEEADLGFQLRCEYTMEGKLYADDSTCVLPAPNPPHKRSWRTYPNRYFSRAEMFESDSSFCRHRKAQDQTSSSSYENWRILSWNTLSDQAIHDWHKKCNDHMLAWPYRFRNIKAHIDEQDADILCLQEIDEKHLEDWWKKYLCQDDTYLCQYAGGKKYGCAIFFRRQKFSMVGERSVLFETHLASLMKGPLENWLKNNPEDSKAIAEAKRNLKVHRQGLIFELSPNSSTGTSSRESNLFVATVHLYKSERKSDPYIRLLQIHALLDALQKFTEGVKNPKVVVAGDFNSEPQTCIYEYMEKGEISCEHADLKDSVLLKAFKQLKCPFKFRSSYNAVRGEELVYCRNTNKATPVVEYIWFTPRTDFRANGVLEFPREEIHDFPQVKNISSDHQLLVADFSTNRVVSGTKFANVIQDDAKLSLKKSESQKTAVRRMDTKARGVQGGMSTPRGLGASKKRGGFGPPGKVNARSFNLLTRSTH